MGSQSKQPPSSILIVGSGVFGLSTAYALAQRSEFNGASITVLERLDFPAADGSSVDASRIVRPDYADGAYAALMGESHRVWRGSFGADGRYTEAGLCFVTDVAEPDGDGDAYSHMQNALKNVTGRLGLKVGRKEDGGQVEPLQTPEDVRRVMSSMGGDCGKRGYVNWTSGWAHAELGVRYMRQLIEATGRVTFRTAEVRRLRFARDRVEGVELAHGEVLTADLVVLATGAWTPKLVDVRGVASATGQVLAYMDITPAEQERLGGNPTLINDDNGMFIIPPRDGVLKVARHGFGYANPTAIPHPEDPDRRPPITVSVPRTTQDDPHLRIPPEGDAACRAFLAKTIPALADRPWTSTKICWYTDTATGDWLVTYHPTYANLFLATGGSGHAFKFLPVVGERVVDVILGHDRDALGAELRRKWAWPTQRGREDHVWTRDWRGGKKGMILDEELAKARPRRGHKL